MLPISIEPDQVNFGDRFVLRFERTLRVPDDGTTYPLPPGLGRFQVFRVRDYQQRVPEVWLKDDGVFISMRQAEALWLSFDSAPWKPSAATVGVGRVNAISGGAWPDTLRAAPQNYLVCPPQLWLDGINAGAAFVRQFVAMPLGQGATVEGQVTGVEAHGGMQIRVYDPKPGRFPDVPPPEAVQSNRAPAMASASPSPMGFVPGGRIAQKILKDPHGLDAWDDEHFDTLIVHVLNSAQHEAVTGRPAPASIVSARTYTEHGFPWFRHYEEDAPDVPPSETLAALSSLAQIVSVAEERVDVPDSGIIDLNGRAGVEPGRQKRS
jgi:hypothetical protein